MNDVKSIEQALIESGKMLDGALAGGRVRAYKGSVDASETNLAADDVVALFETPNGAKLICGFISVTASTGTATLKIGKVDDDDAYMTAAAVTSVNTPVFFTANDDTGGKIVMTVGTAGITAGVVTIWALYAGV